MSNSSWPHGLQHARLPCPSLSPRVCSNSCPLSRWYHLTISSSVTPFSSWPQSFPASGSFPMIQHLTSGGQSIGASASVSVLPMGIQGWFTLRIDLFNLLADKRTHKSPPAPQSKASVLQCSVLSHCSLENGTHLSRVCISSTEEEMKGFPSVRSDSQVNQKSCPLWPPPSGPEQALQGQTPAQPHPPPQACFLL